jgi:cytochrome c peroxidase
MHNGMVESLEDVVAFYNNGGGQDSNKDSRMKKLGLSDSEQKDLVAFLKSLSGDKLTGDKYVWSTEYPEEYEAIENWREVKN